MLQQMRKQVGGKCVKTAAKKGMHSAPNPPRPKELKITFKQKPKPSRLVWKYTIALLRLLLLLRYMYSSGGIARVVVHVWARHTSKQTIVTGCTEMGSLVVLTAANHP